MKSGKIDLYSYFNIPRPEGAKGYLEYCLHGYSKYYPTRKRPALIVAAGGGYSGICEREGEPVAAAYLGLGYNVFNFIYSVAPVRFPAQLIEGAMAVAYIKKNAEELGVLKECVGMVGFSAAGHLSGMMGNLFDRPEVVEALKEDACLARPDAIVMGYPVVIAGGEFENKETITNLSGGDEAIKNIISLEKRVTKNSSPAFIWGTVNDNLVMSENFIAMAIAYKKANVPFEFHLFESGPHGLAIATRNSTAIYGRVEDSTVEDYVNPVVGRWFDMSISWFERHGFEIKDFDIKNYSIEV